MRIVTFAFLLSICLSGLGQDALSPERLFLEQSASDGLFVGVSDPDVDSVTGYWQAVTRAVTLYAYSRNTTASIVSDAYVNENNLFGDIRYEHVMRGIAVFETECTNVSYTVESVSETRQGEKIVALRVSEDLFGLIFTSTYKNYFNAVSYENYDAIDGKTEFVVQLDSCTTNYELSRYDGMCVHRSFFRDSIVGAEQNGKIYDEISCNDCPETDLFNSYSLENGLWQAFVMSFEILSSKIQELGCSVKSIKDKDNVDVHGDGTSEGEGLIRSVTRHHISAVPEYMCIQDNKLVVNWKVNKLE